MKVNDRNVLFSHRPMHLIDGISLNIHGHMHNQGPNGFYADGLMYNLAIENTNYRPILLNTIIKEHDRIRLQGQPMGILPERL